MPYAPMVSSRAALVQLSPVLKPNSVSLSVRISFMVQFVILVYARPFLPSSLEKRARSTRGCQVQENAR